MNDAFSEMILTAYTEEELMALEEEVEREQFNATVCKVYAYLSQGCDHLAGKTDIYVVAAALEMLSNEYNNLTGDDE